MYRQFDEITISASEYIARIDFHIKDKIHTVTIAKDFLRSIVYPGRVRISGTDVDGDTVRIQNFDNFVKFTFVKSGLVIDLFVHHEFGRKVMTDIKKNRTFSLNYRKNLRFDFSRDHMQFIENLWLNISKESLEKIIDFGREYSRGIYDKPFVFISASEHSNCFRVSIVDKSGMLLADKLFSYGIEDEIVTEDDSSIIDDTEVWKE